MRDEGQSDIRDFKDFRRSRLPGYWSRFVGLFFPPLCHACRDFIPDGREVKICDSCLETAAPLVSPLCSCCGRPFPDFSGADHLCGRCSTAPPPFTLARGALLFAGTTRELIHQFKYSGKVMLRRPLALLTADCLDGFVAGFGADLIVPVPLHTKRLRQRGFNQAVLLGEIFAQRWGVPLQRNNLQRSRWTEPQVNLTASARAENVKGAFTLAAPARIAGKRILLVDDVYTTGSTARECSRVLRSAGASSVAVLTVARAAE
jgi:ComF family protein